MKFIIILLYIWLITIPRLSMADILKHVVVERNAAANVTKDLAMPFISVDHHKGRSCADGRDAANFKGDVLEFWGNMECQYCGIREVVKAQREHPEWCIVIRHRPDNAYGESMKKALAYEALHHFSVTAANSFWDAVVPKTDMLPPPYAGSLLRILAEAAIPADALAEVLEGDAARHVQQDMEQGQDIKYTPTFVLDGIRFPACDFSANQLDTALELAKKARSGDNDARQKIIQIITRGQMNEKFL